MLASPISFAQAGSGDDETLRRILRETPLPGWVSLSFEREPSYFAADRAKGGRHVTVVARAGEEIVGFFSRSCAPAYINGQKQDLGYLRELRFVQGYQGKLRAMREGYAYWRDHMQSGTYDLTAILEDNKPARKLLEAGLDGLPTYQPAGGFSTLALKARRWGAGDKAIVQGEEGRLEEIVAFLNRVYQYHQFAPVLKAKDICSRGLKPEDFLLFEEAGIVRGCLAIWDQRAFKQAVVRRYAPALRVLRPLLRLPKVGSALSQASLSFLAVEDKRSLRTLVVAALVECARRGIDFASLGLATNNPLLGQAKADFRHREYKSRLYLVHWEDEVILDDPIIHVDLGEL